MFVPRLYRFAVISVLIAAGLALTGCEDTGATAEQPVVALPPTTSYIEMAPQAPPAPQAEDVPEPANVRTELWRPGYWSWNGSSFDWVAGQMIARPDPTAIWSPDHWIEHTYGWAFEPGYWQ